MGIKDAADLRAVATMQQRLSAVPKLTVSQGAPSYMSRVLQGRFILGESLSWGAAPVILATDMSTEPPTPVAIKMHSNLQAFRHEVHLFRYAPKELVAPIVDAFEDVPQLGHCIVLQHSHTLRDYVAKNRMLPTERRAIVEQLLHMVKYFHKEGGVMCTLSAKILAEYDYSWKLINCEGMRKHGDKVPSVFDACYAAPELVRTLTGNQVSRHGVTVKNFDQDARATRRMDSWSLGLVMFELFTQAPLFKDETEALLAAGGKGIVTATTLGSVDDPQARHLIEQCLQAKPKDRIAVRDMDQHAYVRGGFDDRQIDQSFGSLQRGFKELAEQASKLLNQHESRKLRLKKQMQMEETEDLKRREQERQAELVRQAEEKKHGRNLWMKALDEEEESGVFDGIATQVLKVANIGSSSESDSGSDE
eukprot:c20704_g5_i1.p1 GENE.c20704_g5_i1~~c20704_g5_i1.p1  ORF type:complete len:420 (-),score=104.83 c20704_g5_i1:136-1395(-)